MSRAHSFVLSAALVALTVRAAWPSPRNDQRSAPQSAAFAAASQSASNTQQSAAPSAATTSQAPAPPKQPAAVASNPNADLSAAAWTLLRAGAASEKSRDRSDALSALTVLDSDRKAISLIEDGLDDKEENIRVLAATSLGDIKARAAIPKLKKAMDDKSPEVSFAVAQALWKMGDRSGRDILYEILDGERKTGPGLIKGKMNEAKREMHDPKSLALIGINQAGGAFLGPFSMGLSMIEEYAKNTSAPVQAFCVRLLSSDNSRRTVEELEGALGDKNWAVRAAAARALAKLDHREVVPQLKDMMENDKEQPARFVAAAAIIRLSRKRVRSPASAAAATSARPAKPTQPEKSQNR